MSKKSIALNESFEQIKLLTKLNINVSFESISNAVDKICKNDVKSVEILFKENDYLKYGNEFINCFKKLGVNYSILISEDNLDSSYTSKTISSISAKVCVIVGDDDFIKATNLFCTSKKIKCYAFLTSPCFTELFKQQYSFIETGKIKTKKANALNGLFFCDEIIKKSNVYEILKAYAYNLLQAITLIDYKFSTTLSGKTIDETYYKLLKQALNYTLNFSLYESPFKVLALASFIVNVVDASCDIISNATPTNVIKTLRLLNNGCSLAKLYFIGFEKLIKLYHFYFSNDFSDVLLFPDYVNDIEKLALTTQNSVNDFYDNLKVPSAKRVELINILLKKIENGFLNETSQFIKILPSIEKVFYKELRQQKKDKKIDGEDVKTALRLSTYFTKAQNVSVIMRDLGLLN